MILRQYIRACLSEWHEHLDTVMVPNPDEEGYEDEDDLKANYGKNNRNPKDPYGGSGESRGKRPKSLTTSRAMAHTAGTGFGAGPMSGRSPGGGTTQGFTSM